MLITDTYRIFNSRGGVVNIDRAIYPRLWYFIAASVIFSPLVLYLWNAPQWEIWLKFFAAADLLVFYAIAHLLIPDKLITLEEDGLKFVLRGSWWFKYRGEEYYSLGSSKVLKGVMSDGAPSTYYRLEIRTDDGLRFFMGIDSSGSKKPKELEKLGLLLENATNGRLKHKKSYWTK
ncbi:hypothetical protein [Marinobacter gudaonensis]|uniref:hypothetical protein n=1 Tax=Marinobacter gudaonensis TaxID=375760 RepID=UPI000B81EB8A|nr:hypothetical protein [Marinobacter gudaonensis]